MDQSCSLGPLISLAIHCTKEFQLQFKTVKAHFSTEGIGFVKTVVFQMFYTVSFKLNCLFLGLTRESNNYCFPILAPRKRSDAFSQAPECPNCTWLFEKTPGMV